MKSVDFLRLKSFPQPDSIIIDRPVLLCHGFGALGNVAKKGLLHEIAMMFRARGILAYAPNIMPYGRIETRSQAWKKIIDQIIEHTGSARLHVIAHSMGGLDMRHAIHHLGAHAQVSSLTTVSTPHRGTSLATYMLNAPDTLLSNMADLTNWFGNNVYPDNPSDVLGALEQLSPEFVEQQFNPDCPNHPDVLYQSVTASCGKGTDTPINRLLSHFNKHVYEQQGVNDGYVPVTSARWGKVIGNTTLSHAEQIKISLAAKKEEQWQELWLQIARQLSQL
jgi:triacylglycerol lipase